MHSQKATPTCPQPHATLYVLSRPHQLDGALECAQCLDLWDDQVSLYQLAACLLVDCVNNVLLGDPASSMPQHSTSGEQGASGAQSKRDLQSELSCILAPILQAHDNGCCSCTAIASLAQATQLSALLSNQGMCCRALLHLLALTCCKAGPCHQPSSSAQTCQWWTRRWQSPAPVPSPVHTDNIHKPSRQQ